MNGAGGYGKRRLLVVAVCFAAVVFDGYDLVVYGATVPSLLDYRPWHMDPGMAGAIGSYALAGMLVGALLSGVVTDLIGRRRMMLASVSLFSVFMGACAVAPSPELFGVFRALAGIGLGGVLPTAVALTVEFAPTNRRNVTIALMNSGYSVGAILASVLAIALLRPAGFGVLYAIGAVPLVILVPVAWRWMPESPAYLAAKGDWEQARSLAERFGLPEPQTAETPQHGGVRKLFRTPHLGLLLAFSVACLVGQILCYGLNTWLPEIMRNAGYPLGSSLQLLLALSMGAIVGALVLCAFADRVGGKPILILGFCIAVVSLLLLSTDPPRWLLYVGVALAGVGSNGTMIVLNGYSATRFDADVRGSALGTMMGIGKVGGVLAPLIGGWVVGAGLGMSWSFYVFVIPAAIGVLAVLFDRRRRAPAAVVIPEREGVLK